MLIHAINDHTIYTFASIACRKTFCCWDKHTQKIRDYKRKYLEYFLLLLEFLVCSSKWVQNDWMELNWRKFLGRETLGVVGELRHAHLWFRDSIRVGEEGTWRREEERVIEPGLQTCSHKGIVRLRKSVGIFTCVPFLITQSSGLLVRGLAWPIRLFIINISVPKHSGTRK